MLKNYLKLSLIPLFFIVVAFILQSPAGIFTGIVDIVKAPDLLITDYFVVGGLGGALFNGGIVCLIGVWICYLLKMPIQGNNVTSLFLLLGFAFFGKNIANIWAIIAGTCIYALVCKEHLSKYICIAFYGTSLSPLVTMLFQFESWPTFVNVLLGLAFGTAIGFILPPLSAHLKGTHKGYSLYNVGFACGMVATVFCAIIKAFGIQWQAVDIWSTGNNLKFFIILAIFFGIMFGVGYVLAGKSIRRYLSILSMKDVVGVDFIKSKGMGPALMNMAVNGIVSTILVIVIGSDLNGVTIGCILTIVGFSSTGKTLINILPIMVGVWLCTLLGVYSITAHGVVIAFLLSTTLAPITGRCGIVGGVMAGFVHLCVASSVGVLYGGMNLYNNGFAGGVVAAFLVPVIRSIEDRIHRNRGHIEL